MLVSSSTSTVTPTFLFYKFNENNILNNWEKNCQKSMATFLANEINATDREVTVPTEQVQIMFPLIILNVQWIVKAEDRCKR